MTWVQWLIAIVLIGVCLFLMLVILIQRGRGVGLAGAFGGAGGGGAFGARTGDVLTWITVVVAGVFILLAVVSNYAFDQTPEARPSASVSPEPAGPEPGGAEPSSGPVPFELITDGPAGQQAIPVTPVPPPGGVETAPGQTGPPVPQATESAEDAGQPESTGSPEAGEPDLPNGSTPPEDEPGRGDSPVADRP